MGPLKTVQKHIPSCSHAGPERILHDWNNNAESTLACPSDFPESARMSPKIGIVPDWFNVSPHFKKLTAHCHYESQALLRVLRQRKTRTYASFWELLGVWDKGCYYCCIQNTFSSADIRMCICIWATFLKCRPSWTVVLNVRISSLLWLRRLEMLKGTTCRLHPLFPSFPQRRSIQPNYTRIGQNYATNVTWWRRQHITPTVSRYSLLAGVRSAAGPSSIGNVATAHTEERNVRSSKA